MVRRYVASHHVHMVIALSVRARVAGDIRTRKSIALAKNERPFITPKRQFDSEVEKHIGAHNEPLAQGKERVDP